MKKEFFTFLVALYYTAMANAANGQCIDGIYYILNTNDMTAIVTWGGTHQVKGTEEYKGDIQIPAAVKFENAEYRVTDIGMYAFYNCNELTSISLPNGLKNICDYAFEGCESLSSISFPEGLSRIYNDAFKACTSLTSLSLPKGLQIIFSNAFESCSNLTSISLPEGLEEIMSGVFVNCLNLTSLTIPSTVTSIGSGLFGFGSDYDNCKLKEVFLYSESLTSLGTKAWKKDIPTYVKANSFESYKNNLLMGYKLKVLPDDENIANVIQSYLNLSDEEVKTFNELLKVRTTMGKQQPGPAIEIEGEDGKTLKLYKIKNVKFINEEE